MLTIYLRLNRGGIIKIQPWAVDKVLTARVRRNSLVCTLTDDWFYECAVFIKRGILNRSKNRIVCTGRNHIQVIHHEK